MLRAHGKTSEAAAPGPRASASSCTRARSASDEALAVAALRERENARWGGLYVGRGAKRGGGEERSSESRPRAARGEALDHDRHEPPERAPEPGSDTTPNL